MICNQWIGLMNAELRRARETLVFLLDYYFTSYSGLLPEKELVLHISTQGFLDVPKHVELDDEEVHSIRAVSSRNRSFGNNRSVHQPVVVYDHNDKENLVPLTVLPSLRAPNVTHSGKDTNSETLATSLDIILEDTKKNFLHAINEAKHLCDKILRDKLHPIENRPKEKSKKPTKNSKKESGNKKSTKSVKDISNDNEDASKPKGSALIATKMVEEYETAANEELNRCSARLAIIVRRASKELHQLCTWKMNKFQEMITFLNSGYKNEIASVTETLDRFQNYIEKEQTINFRVILGTEGAWLDEGVIAFKSAPPIVQLPDRGQLPFSSFTLSQIRLLWGTLSQCFPSGIMSSWEMSNFLQQEVVCGVGSQHLPKLWRNLSVAEIDDFVRYMISHSKPRVISWRSFLYDLLPAWNRPSIHHLQMSLELLKTMKMTGGTRVTLSQATDLLFWMEIGDDKIEEELLKVDTEDLRFLLVQLSTSPNESTVCVRELFLFLCRNEDIFTALHSAVFFVEGFEKVYKLDQLKVVTKSVKNSSDGSLSADGGSSSHEDVPLSSLSEEENDFQVVKRTRSIDPPGDRVPDADVALNSEECEVSGNEIRSTDKILNISTSSVFSYQTGSTQSSLYNDKSQTTLNCVRDVFHLCLKLPEKMKENEFSMIDEELSLIYHELSGERCWAVLEALQREIHVVVGLSDLLSHSWVRGHLLSSYCSLHTLKLSDFFQKDDIKN